MIHPISSAASRLVRMTGAVVFSLVLVVAGSPVVGVSASTPALKVTVYCYSTRERTVVKNQSSKTVRITRVGSIYKPYSNEPFSMSRSLGAGKTITFYTGSGATYSSSKTLTRRSIYQNTVGTREGARVRTSAGINYTDRC